MQIYLFLVDDTDVEAMEIQWRRLTCLKYIDIIQQHTILFENIDTITFWVNVLHFKTVVKNMHSKYYRNLLFIAFSKCNCEKGVRVINSVKTKSRNRMQMLPW